MKNIMIKPVLLFLLFTSAGLNCGDNCLFSNCPSEIDSDMSNDGGMDALTPISNAPICQQWRSDRIDLREGLWTGDTETCSPGDLSNRGHTNALRLINLYRSFVELPPVTTDAEFSWKSQACAVLMHANTSLSHTPSDAWFCYTEEGAEAAQNSLISDAPSVEAVDLHMADPGNETTMGHRRWILSNGLGPIGIGSTVLYSCFWVLPPENSPDTTEAEWTAWPPPGSFPIEGIQLTWGSVDETGWTVQSDTIDLTRAKVQVTANATKLPVHVAHLEPKFGSEYAISFVPSGWNSEVGTTYKVNVTGIEPAISYEVTIVNCE